ncbi:thioredoxin [Paractinoplanes lichenicola]|uniref:Thioredoxin n=1 Tax=Paractinoplanes lichenicola TaxID=2802976 RepID=A0ABS1VZ91_9ACTN|nr:thioredoxin [Actinoplanes lichenicola]MBL7259767.1 thioredoxin [Actinoplanes lichenicola]
MTTRAPSLADAEWLDSAPPELDGHVVAYDFWTLTCVNWLRTAPYRRAWWEAYRDDGLIVVGVHTPEFAFEHDPDLIRRAVATRGITYPVVIDSDYEVWKSFDNHFWPALYLADRDGVIRDHHFGEGRYAESERTIQRLLGVARPPVRPEALGVEAEADWDHLKTPETYLGYARGEHFASTGGSHGYAYPAFLQSDQWALDGDWTRSGEFAAVHRQDGSVAFRFEARDANLVLAPESDPVSFQVFLDGKAPEDAHGADISPEGYGKLTEGRMYQLIRQPGPIAERHLEVVFHAPGVRAYVFTFG